MDLHLQSHHWERRSPYWAAAAVAGFAAGAVLMVLELLWATLAGQSPWILPHRIAAIAMGRGVLDGSLFDLAVVATALGIHYLLGIVYGLLMGALIAPFHLDSSAAMLAFTGIVFGAALYLLNFYGMSSFFPWFAELRGVVALLAHLVFGACAALLYWKFEQRAREAPMG